MKTMNIKPIAKLAPRTDLAEAFNEAFHNVIWVANDVADMHMTFIRNDPNLINHEAALRMTRVVRDLERLRDALATFERNYLPDA